MPLDLEAHLADAGYFMRRLAATRRAQELSAAEQFDLARSPLTDDELEEALAVFGTERPTGWGLSELLESTLTKEPASLKVDDLATLQRNLIAQGYAPPDAQPTGEWDTAWYGALRRADAEAREEFYSGHHPGAAPLEAGIRFITNTIPSAVWQGIVGTSRGLIDQAPETAERGGLLGGAAAGAGIGAAAGAFGGPLAPFTAGAGAVAGGLIGGAVGFFSDLFGEDEGEEDQSGWERIADALQPFNEYAEQGPKAFLEDLGFVASASSMVAGAGLAARGVASGIGLAQASATSAGSTFRAALLSKSGPRELGLFGRLTAAATRPALGAERVAKYVNWVKLNGLRAQAGRPIFQTIQGGYTGMSAAQLGARMTAGLGTGTAALDADIAEMTARLEDAELSETERTAVREELARLEAQKVEARTTIQGAIGETNPLPAYVDLLGFLVNPTQFLPVRLGQIGGAARRVLGNADLAPLANIVQHEEGLPLRAAVGRARELLGRDELEQSLVLTWYRRNFGVDMLAAERIADSSLTGAELEGAFSRARAAIVSQLHDVSENPIPSLTRTKVRDASGAPLRVFHGTSVDFQEFNLSSIRAGSERGRGFYFVESPSSASEYAIAKGDPSLLTEDLVATTREEATRLALDSARERGLALGAVEEIEPGVWQGLMHPQGAAPNVRTAYLDIRHPFDFDSTLGVNAAKRINAALRKSQPGTELAVAAGASGQDVFDSISRAVGNDNVSAVLREAGFDGATHLDMTLTGERTRTWIAFEPEQIHAAFGGAFLSPNLVGPTLAERALSWSIDDPVRFESWLVGRRGPSSLPKYLEAERLATRVTRDIRHGALPLESSQIRGEVVADAVAEWERFAGQGRMRQLITQAEALEGKASRTTDLPLGISLRSEAAALRAQAAELKRQLPTVRRIERTAENMVVVPERLDTLTSGDLHGLADEFLRLRLQVSSNAKAGPGTAAWVHARMELQRFVEDLGHRLELPEDLLRDTLKEKPSGRLASYLKKRAATAAGDIDLGPELTEQFKTLGYRPVVTSGDVLVTEDMLAMGELADVGDYTRRAAFFETIGFGVRNVPDESLARLRDAHEVSELGQVMSEAGIGLSGRQAQRHLYDRLAALGRRGVTRGPLHVPAEGRSPIRLPRVDVRDLSPEDILAAFENVAGFTDDTARRVYSALKRGAAYGGEVKLSAPMDTLRSLGRAMRLNGLPGFADFIRTARNHDPNKLVPLSSFAGAGIGLAFGDEPLEDMLKGALGGAVVGLGARAFSKGAYGYLPDRLVKLNTALRYSLNLTFDAGRYTEAASTMMAKYELPGMLRPSKYVAAREWRSPYSAGTVSGETAWKEAQRFLDELNGASYMRWADDTDRRASAVGLLGFNPREHEAGYAWLAYQRGMSKKQIRDVVSVVNRYGAGRAAAEKSANFIFFPFSFSKKYLTTLGDFFLQAPARALLLHEGLRRYHESSLDEAFHEFIEERAPILRELSQINALSYGISPGRFFLQGLSDNRSGVGKALQVLTSVFVPSGAATPLAQAAGGVGDLTLHAFVPVVLTGESFDRAGGVDGLDDIISRYLPLVRDIEDYREAAADQVTALKEGRTEFAQFQRYNEELKEAKADLEPIALALGYASVDGFLRSNVGAAFGAGLDELRNELAERYPTGWRMTQSFENSEALNDRALIDLAERSNRSEAEDAILWLREEQEKWLVLGEVAGLDSSLTGSLAAKQVRSLAKRYAIDRRFIELWNRFFAREYGPLARVA